MQLDDGKKIMVIGAHPDDCDFFTAGTTAKLVSQGHQVKYLSMTNGNAGHYVQRGKELAERRYKEAQASAAVLGITYEVFDIDDGRITPSLENREMLIRSIRKFNPDVIITNRPNDYHVDHRTTSILVQDASFLLAVPAICPDVPAMEACPVILFWGDRFQEPTPFRADIVVPTDQYLDTLVEVVKCHASQSFEWLPWIEGNREFIELPLDKRMSFVEERVRNHPPHLSDDIYRKLELWYGKETATEIQYAECFQSSEYGAPLSEEIRDLFMC